MKYLIINADDFGASRGINRAVLELHAKGVLTSASLMIEKPAAAEAASLAKDAPGLGVGLHVTLTDERGARAVDFNDTAGCRDAIERQLERFEAELGRPPSHVDSHQNIHRDPRLNPLFCELAEARRLPLREHSPVKYFSDFYGQWDGETHAGHISVDNLIRMLGEQKEDIVELSCHPGYVDPDFESPYHAERQIELGTLSDPRLLDFLLRSEVCLINFHDLARIRAL